MWASKRKDIFKFIMVKLKRGDKVKLNGCPFNEQIVSELLLYTFLKDQVMTVTAAEVPKEEGTSGQWVKTNLISEWTDSEWFKKVK